MRAGTPQTRCTAMTTLPTSMLPRRPFGACSSKQNSALQRGAAPSSAAVASRPGRGRCLAAAAASDSALPPLPVEPGQPVVKVCGVTNAEDAEAAAAAGAGQARGRAICFACSPAVGSRARHPPSIDPGSACVCPPCRGPPDWHDPVAPREALRRRRRGGRHRSGGAAARRRAGGRVCRRGCCHDCAVRLGGLPRAGGFFHTQTES